MEKIPHFIQKVREEFIFTDINGETWEEVLRDTASRLLAAGAVMESYGDALVDREREYPTGLPIGRVNLALPHTYPQHVREHAVAIAVPARPVLFRSMDDPEALVEVSLLVCPLLDKMEENIQLLPSMMKYFANEETIAGLAAAGSAQAIFKMLQQGLTVA